MSFLEVARGRSNDTTKSDGWKEVSKVPKPTIRLHSIKEHYNPVAAAHEADDEEDRMFNADFMLNGAKCSRGGKVKFMFKHQPRRKYRRHRFKKEGSSARRRDLW